MRHVHLETTDSTMEEASRLWKESHEPFIVRADQQTNGQGRKGNLWMSPSGGLWLTLAWPMHKDVNQYAGLPLAVGLAVARTLESLYGLSSQIKWPNDILIENRKICGILCRIVSVPPPVLLIGLGINANYKPEEIPGIIANPVTTVQNELGKTVDLNSLCESTIDQLTNVLKEIEDQGNTELIKEVRNRLAWVGRPVIADPGQGKSPIKGIQDTINDEGALCINTEDTTETLDSADSLRLRL